MAASNATPSISWEVPAKRIGIPTTISPAIQTNIGRAPLVGPRPTVERLVGNVAKRDAEQGLDAREVRPAPYTYGGT